MNEENNTLASPRLPVELLVIIKEYIPVSDLRSHVCFYNTCRTTASFYGDSSQQARFWSRACALSGIGWLNGDSSWKEIAFETISKDGFCTHPHCGGALLDMNAGRVERAMKLYKWDPEEGAWDASFDEQNAEEWTREDRPIPVCNTVFGEIEFLQDPMPVWVKLNEARLRSLSPSGFGSWVISHLVAARSFATFPTVRQMRFHYNNFSYGSKAYNAVGVTVWNVLQAIQFDLDQVLTIPELLDLLSGPFSGIVRTQPRRDFVRDLERFSTLRGLWSSSQWQGLHFVRSDGDGPVFASSFVSIDDGQSDIREE
ncbi:hypothetical protein BDW22DRAFT_1363084 [Trametopsis cervina]|nr:hypothetical protein BDW22DRAFT_1363084 [Trametopsis cervina]